MTTQNYKPKPWWYEPTVMMKAREWRADLRPEQGREIVDAWRKLVLDHGMGPHLAFASYETVKSCMLDYRDTEWDGI